MHAPGQFIAGRLPRRPAMDGKPETFWVSEKGPEKEKPQWLLLTLEFPRNRGDSNKSIRYS